MRWTGSFVVGLGSDRRDAREAASVRAARGPNEPHPDRLPLDDPWRPAMLDVHAAAIDLGESGYLDPRRPASTS